MIQIVVCRLPVSRLPHLDRKKCCLLYGQVWLLRAALPLPIITFA